MRRHCLYLFGLGLLYRLVLLWLFPALYGGDSIGRLAYRDSIFFGHWLPFPQTVIVIGYKLTESVLAVRIIIITLTCGAALTFYGFVRRLAGERAGFIAGHLFTFSPLFVYLSLVPYQEVIFLGFLFGALIFLFENGRRRSAGFLFFGLACLTRYEGWFLLPVLLTMEIHRTRTEQFSMTRVRHLLVFVAGLTWGPVLWLIMNKLHWGEYSAFLFHKQGTAYFWQPHQEISRIARYVGRMFVWIIKYGSPVTLLAPLGIYFHKKEGRFSNPIRALIWLTTINFIFLTFVAGREFDNDFRFAAIPVALLLVFSAISWPKVSDWLIRRTGTWLSRLLPACGLFILAIYATMPVLCAVEQPKNSGAYAASRFLAQNLRPGETAVVLAPGFRDYPEVIPMPCQRIGAQLNDAGDRLLCSSTLRIEDMSALSRLAQTENIRYIVQFGEFEPWVAADVVLMTFLQRSGGINPTVFQEGEMKIVQVNSWNHADN